VSQCGSCLRVCRSLGLLSTGVSAASSPQWPRINHAPRRACVSISPRPARSVVMPRCPQHICNLRPSELDLGSVHAASVGRILSSAFMDAEPRSKLRQESLIFIGFSLIRGKSSVARIRSCFPNKRCTSPARDRTLIHNYLGMIPGRCFVPAIRPRVSFDLRTASSPHAGSC
jgi:hypothetical protein